MANWDVNSGTGGILRISATEVGVDIENNTSTVSAAHQIYVPAATWWNEGSAASLSGDHSWNGSVAAPWTGSARWITGHTGSTTKPHNADGTGSFSLSGYIASTGTTGFAGPTSNGPHTLALTTIPRATVPTLTNSSRQIGQSTTINLPRASESFTHDISYSFGSLTGQTAGLSASSGVGTSATFTVPTALVAEMVGQSSKPLTFTVVTKSGVTVVGSKTVQLTVTPANGTIYQRPTVNASVVRALSDGTPDDDGVRAKVTITAEVTSVLISTEQNTLTWKTEVSSNNGSSWQQLGTGTVGSHGLTLNSSTTYTDSDPGTGGTQPFSTTAGYLFRVTITDAYSSVATQVVQMTTASAIIDIYDGDGDPDDAGLSIGALFNTALGSRLQIGGEPIATSQPGTPYTPTIGGATVGNGVLDFKYWTLGERYYVAGTFTLGSTSSISGEVTISTPVAMDGAVNRHRGVGVLYHNGVAIYPAHLLQHSSNTAVRVRAADATSAWGNLLPLNAAVPFWWGSGDVIDVEFSFWAA